MLKIPHDYFFVLMIHFNEATHSNFETSSKGDKQQKIFVSDFIRERWFWYLTIILRLRKEVEFSANSRILILVNVAQLCVKFFLEMIFKAFFENYVFKNCWKSSFWKFKFSLCFVNISNDEFQRKMGRKAFMRNFGHFPYIQVPNSLFWLDEKFYLNQSVSNKQENNTYFEFYTNI